MRALSIIALGAISACAPEAELARYVVSVTEVDHCIRRGAQPEACEEPEAVSDTIPVIIETIDEAEVVLYAADPETGDERAFRGVREADELTLTRIFTRVEEETDCRFRRQADLALTLDGDDLSGAERVVTEETAGCNELGLDTAERAEWSWRGERVTD